MAGEDGHFDGNDGYLDDMWALHLDSMSDFYPSESALDLSWQKLSLSSGGDAPSARAYHSLVPWGSALLLFGGMSNAAADMHNSTFSFSTTHAVWQQLTISGGPIAPMH